ncbi:hypothetical protein Syun_025625 [Stephania yunnanensis]|uniref:Plastocyanin-like domain-containing protein n=1 Tax=Stephania yunnanensis TaxID=152371 RepID=A0AAP0HWC5_9MAGN
MKEEAIAGFDRYNHAATIEREVHDQLTLEEALAELDEIPHHRYRRGCGLKGCTRRKEYLYHDHHLLTRNPCILINGRFSGPQIDCVTNDNGIVNVINKLDQPFLNT